LGRNKKKVQGELSESLALKVSQQTERERLPNKGTSTFIAPELLEIGASEDVSGYENKSSWDVAVRFQDLKRLGHIPDKEKQLLKRRAIEGVISRAQRVLGSVLKPERTVVVDYPTFQEKGGRGELDVLATLEEDLARGHQKSGRGEDVLRFDARIEKDANIALVMDASLSMTGEKIALLAVATAVVALCVPTKRLSLMGFDSRVRWVKRFEEELTVEQIIERVLELPAGGFTNMEIALKETLKMLDSFCRVQANVILISDGKYTEGNDPTEFARRFRHLNVLKIGRDQAGRDLLLDLTSLGSGQFFEARRISDLPRTMYGAMRTLLR
jgi:Mg-chelatase subunit ChlD